MQVIFPPGRGRRPSPINYGEPRHLTQTDIATLWEQQKNSAPRLKTLRYNHHILAKAVASGKSLLECSTLTGLSYNRCSDIKNDPAFQELVSFYAEELNEIFVDVHKRMAAFGTSILEELQERFEEDPDKFTKRELLDIFTTMADRSIPTAKGGPAPQAATLATGANGLALQINFVSPTTQAPAALEGSISHNHITFADPTPAGPQPDPASAVLDEALRGIDGEIDPPHVPQPAPAPAEIQAVKLENTRQQVEKRETEEKERDRIYQEYLVKRRQARGGV